MGRMEFNFNEQRVQEVLGGENFNKKIEVEKKTKLTLKEIAQRGFPHVRPSERAISWVRNSLRTLVSLGMAKQVERGTYQATGKAKPKVEDKRKKAPAKKAPPKKPAKPAKKAPPKKPAPVVEAAAPETQAAEAA